MRTQKLKRLKAEDPRAHVDVEIQGSALRSLAIAGNHPSQKPGYSYLGVLDEIRAVQAGEQKPIIAFELSGDLDSTTSDEIWDQYGGRPIRALPGVAIDLDRVQYVVVEGLRRVVACCLLNKPVKVTFVPLEEALDMLRSQNAMHPTMEKESVYHRGMLIHSIDELKRQNKLRYIDRRLLTQIFGAGLLHDTSITKWRKLYQAWHEVGMEPQEAGISPFALQELRASIEKSCMEMPTLLSLHQTPAEPRDDDQQIIFLTKIVLQELRKFKQQFPANWAPTLFSSTEIQHAWDIAIKLFKQYPTIVGDPTRCARFFPLGAVLDSALKSIFWGSLLPIWEPEVQVGKIAYDAFCLLRLLPPHMQLVFFYHFDWNSSIKQYRIKAQTIRRRNKASIPTVRDNHLDSNLELVQ